MEDLKDDYREGEPVVQYAIDTLLLPFRIATSPVLLRTYLRTILLFITSTILLGLAAVAYTSFYYSYIPVRGITAPVYLQFHHGATSRPPLLELPNTDAQNWPYGIVNIPGLVSQQKYDVVVSMTVPRSTTNLNAGNWMVGLEMRGPSTTAGGVKGMLGWDEEWDHSQGGGPGETTQHVGAAALAKTPTVIARSRRPAILTYRSYVLEHVHRLLRLPLYLLGWHTESETIRISMMEGVEFDKGANKVPTSVKVELRSKQPLEVYTVIVHFSAKLEGLRYLMYQYKLTSALVGISLFWGVELGVLVFTWGVFTLLFSSSSSPSPRPSSPHPQTKPDPDAMTPKTELDPDTPLSETPRTFPTLPSHHPLHYPDTSPKSERTTPALHDIPLREDAEADDEEDDDFVLQEPVPRGVDRDGVFTDSGIGTGVESGGGRESLGAHRRRSARREER
ncbi:putative adipose-regulatory protein-domain-containing protein [Ampelomyces quisqualis]|uniref:Putative adipose-regulatory protein-domain-containing protein n=1 Tax=Ampelomyces quisqualis TaxID=50730 RepID=A0A6A5QYP9_AMPQU|nr:putative adipose-regulatory protein-domain-containing protein [Ampelomyces quisqualis]